FIPNFWCRYLCPYGALLGLFALAGPLKISRNTEHCTDCKACSRACPSGIAVAEKDRVISPECTGCLSCVNSCPTKGALDIGTKKRVIAPQYFAVVVLLAFFGAVGLGMATDNWNSKMPKEEYARIVPRLATPDMKKQPIIPPDLQHP
ncbi:MAG: 4Fe-4S binding protein, partial [Thermodesulfovibrionales bacterium]|nr:4Fe-4S binding protein [Thermodesulfovibrionales bacterium]